MTDIKVFEGVSVAAFQDISAADNNACMCNLFNSISGAGIDLDMISVEVSASDKISLGFTFSDNDLTSLLAVVNDAKGSVGAPMISCGNVKFVVKSPEMINKPGFAAKVFTALRSAGCIPLLVTTSLDEISLLVSDSDSPDAAKQLEKLFN